MAEQTRLLNVKNALALAREHFQAGRLQPAETIALKIIEAEPDHFDAVGLMGAIAYRQGKADDAIVWFQRALKGNPDSATFHGNLCEIYRNMGDLEQAIEMGKQAVRLDATYFHALNSLGAVYSEMKDFAVAEAFFHRAIVIAPRMSGAYNGLGNVLRAQNRRVDALAAYQQALSLRPTFAEALINFASMLRDDGKLEDAERALRKAVGLKPNAPEAYFDLASVLWSRRRAADARAITMRLLSLKPDHMPGLVLAGQICCALQDFEAAKVYLAKALEIEPRSGETFNQLSIACLESGDLAAANEALLRLVALDPADATNHVRRSMLRMLMGDIDGGLGEYEWRLKVPHVRPDGLPKLRPERLPGQRWCGEALEGKSLFIWCEQGLGDTVHCMRFLPSLLAQAPAKLYGQIPPKLHPLARLNFPDMQLVEVGSEPPITDYHVEMMSLLRLVGRSEKWKENGTAYLKAPEDQVARFNKLFESYRGLKIGVVWAGNGHHKDDGNRSMPGAQLMALLEQPGCHFFSLQTGPKGSDAKLFQAGLIDFAGEVRDMMSAAAAIAALDLVIAVDTSLAHVAGALGTPVLTLLAAVPDWRWGLAGEKTRLYRSMRLVRQTSRRDWPEVIAKVSAALSVKSMVNAKAGPALLGA